MPSDTIQSCAPSDEMGSNLKDKFLNLADLRPHHLIGLRPYFVSIYCYYQSYDRGCYWSHIDYLHDDTK